MTHHTLGGGSVCGGDDGDCGYLSNFEACLLLCISVFDDVETLTNCQDMFVYEGLCIITVNERERDNGQKNIYTLQENSRLKLAGKHSSIR